jgi:hypothetical protein
MSSAIEEEFIELHEILCCKAPRLRPRIIPRGYDDGLLLNLAKTEKQKTTIISLIEKCLSSQSHCYICQQSCNNNNKINVHHQNSKNLNFVVDFSIDIKRRLYKFERAMVCTNSLFFSF